jgi:SWI/SNF-related matrix-associated actin-dependent regulator 1 of chromatin subfamily A
LTPDDADGDVVNNERNFLKKILQEYMRKNKPVANKDDETTMKALATLEDNIEEFSSNAEKLMSYIGETKNSAELLSMVAIVRKQTAMAKLKPAIDLLEDYLEEEKVVVFAHHRDVIDALLDHFGNRAVAIMGGMEREERDGAVKMFQENDSTRLFVGSIRAAGIGLTLTASSHVVFLELDWSPGVMAQAEDRCHRVGQSDSVRVQYFVFRNTIDEWLSKSLLYKQHTIDSILPEKQGGIETGYIFNFGKHGTKFLVPRSYLGR